MTRIEQMMNAAEAYAAGLYADEPVSFSTEEDRCVTMNDFCAGWKAADHSPQWIPVEEELPKADGRYIIADKYGGVEQMNFDAESKCWWLRGTGWMRDFVTHWMPLPEAPRKEADND